MENQIYSGWFRRIVAFVVDAFLIQLLASFVFGFFFGVPYGEYIADWIAAYYVIYGLLMALVLGGIQSKHGTTLGMKLLGIMYVQEDFTKCRATWSGINYFIYIGGMGISYVALTDMRNNYVEIEWYELVTLIYLIYIAVVVIGSLVVRSRYHKNQNIFDRAAQAVVVKKRNFEEFIKEKANEERKKIQAEKEQEKEEEEISEKEDQKMEGKTYFLHGLSGQFKGKEWRLNQSLIFGRDASRCDIIFAEDTPGISRKHCKIEEKQGKVTVTDLGATYGTMINGTNCLKDHKEMSIESGDQIVLGKEEKFCILAKQDEGRV